MWSPRFSGLYLYDTVMLYWQVTRFSHFKRHAVDLPSIGWSLNNQVCVLGLLEFMSLIHTCLSWHSEVFDDYSHNEKPFHMTPGVTFHLHQTLRNQKNHLFLSCTTSGIEGDMPSGHTQFLWLRLWHISSLLVWTRDFWPTLPSKRNATFAPMTPIWGQWPNRGNKLLAGVVSPMSKWGLVQFGPTQWWVWHTAYFSSNPPRFWVLGFATSVYFLLVETVGLSWRSTLCTPKQLLATQTATTAWLPTWTTWPGSTTDFV